MGKAISNKNEKIANQSTKPVNLLEDLGIVGTEIPDVNYKQKENKYENEVIAFNPLEYNEYIDNPNPTTTDNIDYLRAINQSENEQLGNSMVQFGANLIGGFAMGLGASLDLKQGLETAIGTEKEFDNVLYNWSEEFMKNTAENFPIYQEQNSDEKSEFKSEVFGDPAYWLNQFAQQGLSVGIMGQSMLETAGVTMLTGGLGLEAELTNSAKKLNMVEKLFSVSKNSDKIKRDAILFGFLNRHNESIIESTGVFNENYKRLLEEGVDEEKARESSAQAAALDYRLNMPLALIDAAMFRTMTYNPITKKGVGTVEKVLDKISNPILKEFTKLATTSLGESLEEVYQTVATNESQHRADVLAGVTVDNSTFTERLSKYLGQNDVINSAIGGLIGGVFLGGMGELYNNASENKNLKSLKLQNKDFIENIVSTNLKLIDEIRKAEDENREMDVFYLRKQAAEMQALQAIHLDNLLDREDENTFNTYLLKTEEVLRIATSGTDEEKAKLNLDDASIEYIKEEYPKYISDAKRIKELYDLAKESVDPSAIIPIVSRQLHLEHLNEKINDVQNRIAQLENKIPDYNNLTPAAASIYKTKLSILSLQKIEKQILSEINDVKNLADKKGLTEQLATVRFEKTKLTNALNSVNSENLTILDRQILAALPEQKELEKLIEIKNYLGSKETSYRKQLEVWNNPAFQKQNKRGKYKTIIKKTETIDELESLKKTLDDKKELSLDLEKQINSKIEVLKKKKEEASLTQQSTESKNILENLDKTTTVDSNGNEIDKDGNLILKPLDNSKEVEKINDEKKELIKSMPFGVPINDISIDDVKQTESSTVIKEKAEDNLFEPDNFDSFYEPSVNELPSDILKSKVKNYYDVMSKEEGKNPTFKEMLEDMILQTSLDDAKNFFEHLKLGWKLNGFEETDFDKVYNEVLNSRKNIARDLAYWGVMNPISSISSNFVEQNNQDKKEKEILNTENNQENEENILESTYINETFSQESAVLKLAFLHRPYERITEEDEEGNIVTKFEDISDELSSDDNFVNSIPLMNPDFFKPGTKFTIKIADNPESLPVAIWNKKNWSREKATSFGNWVKQNNVTLNSDEYLSKVPIFVYAEGIEKPVAMIHDLDWYNPTNVKTKDVGNVIINQARKDLLQLRKQLFENKGKLIGTIVSSEKTTGQILRLENRIKISEATGQSSIGYVAASGNIVTNNNVIFKEEDLINSKELQPGHTYDVRRWRTDETGKPTFIALPVYKTKLESKAVDSVVKALQTYLMQHINTPDGNQFKKIRNEIFTKTGIDLFTPEGLQKYISQFIKTEDGNYGNGDTKSQIAKLKARVESSSYDNGYPIITINKGSVIVGKKGMKMSGENQFVYASPSLMLNSDKGYDIIRTFLEKIYKPTFLGSIFQNVDSTSLINDKEIHFIDLEGNVTVDVKYSDYLKNNFETNIKSFNVGTEEKPIWATAYQPVINFSYEKDNNMIVHENNNVVKIEDSVNPESEEIAQLTGMISSRSELKELGMTDAEIDDLYNNLKKSNNGISFDEPNYSGLTSEKIANIKNKISTINELNSTAKSQLVRFIARKIESKIDSKYKSSVSIEDINEAIKNSFEEIFTPKYEKLNKNLEVLSKLYDLGNKALSANIESIKAQLKNIDVVRKNYDALIAEARTKEINKYTGIKEKVEKNTLKQENLTSENESQENQESENDDLTEDEQSDLTDEQDTTVEQDTQIEVNYSKTSLEENTKSSVTYVLKRFMAQIPLYDNNGNVKLGFLGVTEYPGFDYYYNLVLRMLTSKGDVPADYDAMVSILREYDGKQKWICDFLNRLSTSSGQIKNAFVNGLALHATNTNLLMFGESKKTGKTIKVYEANANEIIRVIQEKWYQNFNHSDLVKQEEDGTVNLNLEKAKKLLAQFETWKWNKNVALNTLPKNKEISTWLNEFGINLTENAINEIIEKGYFVNENDKFQHYSYKRMFFKSEKTNGLFGLLARKLELLINMSESGEKIDFLEDEDLHPLYDSSNIFKKIATIEKNYNNSYTSNSHKDGSKSIYDMTPQTLITNMTTELLNNKEYRSTKKKIIFDRNSYILNLLETYETLPEKIKLSHGAINILKEYGKKQYKDSEMNTLSDKDHEFVKIGMFQDTQQGNVTYGKDDTVTFEIDGEEYKLPMRMATMLFPTMSDKKTTVNFRIPVLKINTNSFDKLETKIQEGENSEKTVKSILGLNENVLNFLYSQIIKPELDRIITHHFISKQSGISPDNLINQEDVNKGRQIFHFIPQLNNVIVKNSDKRIVHYIAEHADLLAIGSDGYKKFIEENKQLLLNTLQETIKSLTAKKLESWKNNDFFVLDENKNVNSHKAFSKKYTDSLNEKQIDLNAEIAAYDFVINYMVSNANMYMLFVGDVANYSKNKAFKNKNLFENGKPYLAKTNKAYIAASKGVISVNLGKRLAMMIAPGRKLANSIGDKYVQLFAKDFVTYSTNLKYLIETHYGKQDKEVYDILDKLNNSKTDNEVKGLLEILSDKFPEIADFMDIEATDAQEYTTSKEALDIIYRQGRMSDKEYETLNEKLKKQTEAEEKGIAIPEDALLSDKEIKLVFSPLKPVYTDISPKIDEQNTRVTYIKSSSFPLLPQFTIGTNLNGLRIQMEKLQKNTGYNVRLSYNTANKVGAVISDNQLLLWDKDGNFIENSIDVDKITNEILKETSVSARILNRNNFRIQQDVPYKSAKRKADTIRIGSQMMKEIFGDGIAKIKDKIFTINGKQLSGSELLERYNSSFISWINNEKKKLYDELGIDFQTGKPIDSEKTTEKLQQILKEEAEKRGYPIQDIHALEVFTEQYKGQKLSQFVLPLWLSPNSNRYEALLNAIVANRLVKLKLPGNSFVVGSQAGFKLKNENTYNNSKTVYSSKYDGELKAAYTEDGKLIKAQVLIPSKFRNNKGELIDLSSDTYSYYDKKLNRRMLKENMIDSELLSNSSFRIPTSSLVSMSQIEVVGFLPVEVGDLMIVPKNFTKQKGLDFDVDKENVYQLWHKVDENGKIVKLTRQNTKNNKGDKTLESKFLQNDILDVYSSILSSPDVRVQKKIQKVLSMDFARGQAEILEKLNETSEDDNDFTILSDEYQKYKMNLGSSGKSGIGVYSNYVVLNSLIQQINSELFLQKEVINEQGNLEKDNLTVKIGNSISNGKLGNLLTIDKSRSIAEVLAERQNTATDNEKEQIMGRTNINEYTINVDSILVLLGFDKTLLDDKKTEISIPYFLLSQPIIKDYVRMLKNAKSLTSDFDSNAKETIIKQLYNLYGGEIVSSKIEDVEIKGTIELANENTIDELRSNLTGQALYDNITKPDNLFQQTVLHLFLELEEYSQFFTILQNRLGIQTSGLGKSTFELIEKYNGLKWFIKANNTVTNVTDLVGNFVQKTKANYNEIYELLKTGKYIDFGDYIFQPTTPVGSIIGNAVKSGYELWSGFFPHTNPIIEEQYNQILDLLGKQVTDRKRVEIKQEVFNDLKKYLFSSSRLGLFNLSPEEERQRLFFDNDKNVSLAGYLNKLSYNNEYKNIINDNKLLSSFSYKLEKTFLPSLIKYNNTDSEDFMEEYKYQALVELMDNNQKLPDYNGDTEYTTRKLAMDLIAYTYLSGGIQKAIEFVKYVPVAYLQQIGFTKTAQMWQNEAGNNTSALWKEMLGINTEETETLKISRFGMQFAQHHPELFTKIKEDEIRNDNRLYATTSKKLSDLLEFDLKNFNKNIEPFVTIYNKDLKSDNKYQLYIFNGKNYSRVNVLGTFGMSEYSIRNDNVVSIIPTKIKVNKIDLVKPVIKQNEFSEKEMLFKINEGNLKNIIEEISKSSMKDLAYIAKLLLPYVENIPVQIENINSNGTYMFDKNSEVIYLSKSYINSPFTTPYQIAKTLLHEYMHAITAKELVKYTNKDKSINTNLELPSHISKLVRIFKEAQKELKQDLKRLNSYYNDEGVINKEDKNAYAVKDIFEFVAEIMTNEEFQKRMNEVKYKETNKSIWEQFVDVVKTIFQNLNVKFKEDTLATNAIMSVMELLEEKNKSNKKVDNTNPFSKFGISVPTESDLKNLKPNDDSENKDSYNEAWINKENNTDCIF